LVGAAPRDYAAAALFLVAWFASYRVPSRQSAYRTPASLRATAVVAMYRIALCQLIEFLVGQIELLVQ